MKEAFLDTKEAGSKSQKFHAARDAEIKSYACSTHYSDAEKLVADRVKVGLEMCYSGSKFYTTFRKKFITIKIDNASVRDSKSLKILEDDYETRGITKAVSPQGVIYRIPKV